MENVSTATINTMKSAVHMEIFFAFIRDFPFSASLPRQDSDNLNMFGQAAITIAATAYAGSSPAKAVVVCMYHMLLSVKIS